MIGFCSFCPIFSRASWLLRFAAGRGFQPAEAALCLKRLIKDGAHEEFDME